VGGRFADDVAFQSALVEATQASTNESLYIFDDGYDFIPNHNSLSGASQSSRSENAFGGGFGAAIDLSITPHWSIRGEYAFSVFPTISVHLSQSLGTASRLTFQPLLQAVRLGAIYNF
jgi:opacity protein-like surface antigen